MPANEKDIELTAPSSPPEETEGRCAEEFARRAGRCAQDGEIEARDGRTVSGLRQRHWIHHGGLCVVLWKPVFSGADSQIRLRTHAWTGRTKPRSNCLGKRSSSSATSERHSWTVCVPVNPPFAVRC